MVTFVIELQYVNIAAKSMLNAWYLRPSLRYKKMIGFLKLRLYVKNEMLKRTSVFWPNGVLKGVGKGGMNPPPPYPPLSI